MISKKKCIVGVSSEKITTSVVQKSPHLRQSFELQYKESPMFLIRPTRINVGI